MDAFDMLLKELDDKLAQLKEFLAEGKAETFEDYKRLCGEIRGLLTAKDYTIALKRRLETLDE